MPAKPKPKKVRKLSLFKKDLWKEFALFVKLQRSVDGAWVNCYTCNANLQIGTSNCHAGHWLPQGGYSGMVFVENNVRPQCYVCNVRYSGNTPVFEQKLREEIGDAEVDAMYLDRRQSGKHDRGWYQQKTAHYKHQNQLLRQKHGHN